MMRPRVGRGSGDAIVRDEPERSSRVSPRTATGFIAESLYCRHTVLGWRKDVIYGA